MVASVNGCARNGQTNRPLAIASTVLTVASTTLPRLVRQDVARGVSVVPQDLSVPQDQIPRLTDQNTCNLLLVFLH